jgi:ribosomal-protein-alanine N-acetyltransferase
VLRRDIHLLDVEIVTERLILRPLDLVDLEPIAREFDEQVTRYMYSSAARSAMDVAPFIADSIEGLTSNTNLQLVAVLQENPKTFVGCLGLHKPHTTTPELGIWVADSSIGKGSALKR